MGKWSDANKISRTAKIFYGCNLVVLQYSLHSWKQELCSSSSILGQRFNFIRYCHFLHAHSKCFCTELLPTSCATETLAAAGWECKHLPCWFLNIWHLKLWRDWCKSSPKLQVFCSLPTCSLFGHRTPIPESSCGRSVSSKPGIFPSGLAVERANITVI